ncbi:MAG: hypothetical protein HY056_06420, partial [Proteobacteria bacterium]|nr:hypothetical protein [Pseudomonadota bacterium]
MDRKRDISGLERLLRCERAATLIALVMASLAAWAYTLAGAGMGAPSAPLAQAEIGRA